ncbi:molybdenum cofactor biosynthesis protein MoaD [Bacillus anthracis]|nr:molybdenum cofactor biosynthesis protein MoaD [Bacillus anthracis]KOS26923.1 molybdenum cofactor biosynthesis protein MoaD [Bacillus anthracis]
MIKVLLFANLQEEVGRNQLQISEKQKMTVAAIKRDGSKQNIMYQSLETMIVAINEEYAKKEETIQAGDIVALIPPVSGG